MHKSGMRKYFRSTLAIATALVTAHSVSHAQTSYDKYAYIKSLPTSPISPTELWQCDKWLERSNSVVIDVNVAHSACLREETSKPFGELPPDTKDSCSKPACQKLHDSLSTLRTETSTKGAKCREEVNEKKKKVEGAERAKQQRRLRDAQTDPCIRDWLQYEALCTGKHDPESVTRFERDRAKSLM